MKRLGRVDDVVGSEAVVEPAGLVAESLGLEALSNGGREGDDVVFDFGFDLVDSLGGG